MFPHLKNFNLEKWIEENRHNWGQRKRIWEDSDFLAFVTRGPNSRSEFHIDPSDEIFYQLVGELNLHYITKEGKRDLTVIHAGELFLLPAKVPHSPRRGEGSWTFVVERKRRPEERDQWVWYCEKCNGQIYETFQSFDDGSEAVKRAYQDLKADEKLRTCSACGTPLAV